MLEIARSLQKIKRPKNAPPIRFVAFDGEEATDDSDFLGTGVRGSKAFAKKHAKEIHELILLDFVADKDLAIPASRARTGDVGGPARRRLARGADGAFPDATRARSRTTTRRSWSAASRRST